MNPPRSPKVQAGIYRAVLHAYPRAFRREYAGLMTQAFCDRLRERGPARAWILIVADLAVSVPQQLLEVSIMRQKWMAGLAIAGSLVILGMMALGAGPPLVVLALAVGLFVMVPAMVSLRAARRAGRPTEYAYAGAGPKAWTWWTVLAAVLAALYVAGAATQLITNPKATNLGAMGIALGFAALIASGLWLRSQSRISGNWMVVVAAVPALTFFWVIVPTVLALAIIVGSVTEIARARPQAPLPS